MKQGLGAFAINLVSVSRVLPIYCYLGEYQERGWWQINCCPGAGPGEVFEVGRGLEPMRKEEKAWRRSFCCSEWAVERRWSQTPPGGAQGQDKRQEIQLQQGNST